MPCKRIEFQMFFLVLVSAMTFLVPKVSIAQNAFSNTGLPLPRFVSLASDKVYMRSGPGTKYPVLWEFKRKNYPVEIIMEFDIWRKIRSEDGTEGWVHKSLLSGRRFVTVQADDLVPLHRKPDEASRLMAYIEPGAIASLDECQALWCKISSQGYEGWIQRKFLWGVYDTEILN